MSRLQPASSTVRLRLLQASIGALLLPALGGCAGGVLDPKGPIAAAERIILLNSLAIMLVIAVPTIVLTIAFAWWFRSGNTRAVHLPEWAYSGRLEALVWAIPALIVMFLGGIAWIGSHELDPWQRIESPNAPIEVEVVSLDWKWLFIYPEQGIASVNELTIPANTPVHFRLTSETVMNSFFVPQLGSQIYTMAGMASQLSLLADAPGTYAGRSVQYSGEGFSDMHFDVRAVTPAEFAAFVEHSRTQGATLDLDAYEQLARPGVEAKPRIYAAVAPRLFDDVLMHTMGMPPMTGPMAGMPHAQSPSPHSEH